MTAEAATPTTGEKRKGYEWFEVAARYARRIGELTERALPGVTESTELSDEQYARVLAEWDTWTDQELWEMGRAMEIALELAEGNIKLAAVNVRRRFMRQVQAKMQAPAPAGVVQ